MYILCESNEWKYYYTYIHTLLLEAADDEVYYD